MQRFREWFSIRLAKNPGQIVLLAILFFNIVFLLLAAFIISRMSLTGTEHLGFLEAAYYTVTMILDAGCVSFVKPGSGVVLFSGDQSETAVKLESGDKIIVFSNH